MAARKILTLAVSFALLLSTNLQSQVQAIVVTTTSNAQVLADYALQDALVLNAQTFAGADGSSGTFTNGPFNIGNGVILTTGKASDAPLTDNTRQDGPNTQWTTAGSSLCSAVVGNSVSTYDAAVLSMNLTVPTGYNGINVYFVFASEEYPE